MKSNEEESVDQKEFSTLEVENLNFVKDIKGFYNKIHDEIH